MAIKDLPEDLHKEVAGLRQFEVRPVSAGNRVVLEAMVRGVPIQIHLDPTAYPLRIPELLMAESWSWREISAFERERRITGLQTQERWNRTLGLGTLLRDLERMFSETPPARHEPGALQRQTQRLRAGGRWMARSFTHQLSRIRDWLRGKFKKSTPVTRIRSDYEQLIQQKASRIERYRQALTKLEEQWEKRKDRLHSQEELIDRLTRGRAETLRQSGQAVKELRSDGGSTQTIKAEPAYRDGLAAYSDQSLLLVEENERLRQLEKEAEVLHGKLRDHEVLLEAQIQELAELKQEAREVEAELTLTQIEQEILDIRTGVQRSDLALQREEMLRSVRDKQAKLRVSKQLAGVEKEIADAEYLERGQEVSATQEFDSLLGLDGGKVLGSEETSVDDRLRQAEEATRP